MASRECGGGQGQPSSGHRSCHITRWAGYCYQIYLLCVSLIARYLVPVYANPDLQSRESGYSIWNRRWEGRGGREDDQVANGALIRTISINLLSVCLVASIALYYSDTQQTWDRIIERQPSI